MGADEKALCYMEQHSEDFPVANATWLTTLEPRFSSILELNGSKIDVNPSRLGRRSRRFMAEVSFALQRIKPLSSWLQLQGGMLPGAELLFPP